MRTELRLPDVPVRPGDVTIIEIEVANTADVIDGVTARVEGIDPSWVQFPTPVLSLFPESTGTLQVHVRFPPTTVVGDYLVVINVESTIDPTRRSTHDLWLRVDPIEAASMRLRPSVVTKGKRATFAAIVANEGNVVTNYTMTAVDETRVLDCSARPLTLTVPPGSEGVAEVEVRGPRPWFGQPVARTVTIGAESAAVTLREVATFNQRPRIPRGLLTLALLAGIVSLWAAIFLVGVDLLRQGDDPAKAVAENFNSTGDTQGVQNVPLAAVAGSMLGKVTAQATGDGLALITVEAYRVTSSGATELTGSAGTAEDGTYTLASLIPGTYQLRFTAEGFDELWYPAATSVDGASEVPLKPTGKVEGLDVTMVGRPGAFVGSVELPDSATPGELITVSVTELVEQPSDDAVPAPPQPPPLIQQTPGPVDFAGLVTPGRYRIRVEAQGFEPQEFEQKLEGGETRVLNTVRLGAAAGSISGTVRSSAGVPLGNVKVTVTSGDIEREATTPTAGNVGTFVVDGLATPRTYVLTFTLEGFSSQTIALDLAAGANRTGVDATLTGGTGTINGTVTDTSGQPLGGVEVSVTRGDFAADTKTLTTAGPGAGVGSYTVSDLPTPGTFAVTFSLDGYVSETRSVGFLVPGLQPDISVTMRRSDASIVGTVTGGGRPIVGASVELSDGMTSRTTATASTPNGGYTFTAVPPGSYTLTVEAQGFARRIVLIQVAAGDALTRDVDLGGVPLMHVTAMPILVELPVGQPAQLAVSITNTSAIIDAYSVRAFGLDPQWLVVDQPRLSLFPSEVGVVEITVTLPPDFPAGMRTVAVHVQSENDPTEFSLAQIALDVGMRPRTSLRVDPVTVTGGNAAQFSLIVANDGNATVQARPDGVDPEDVVAIEFEPSTVVLPPGRREVVRADVRGGRPWFGQPRPRVLSFSLGGDSPPAMATFIQRPRIGRWLISLLGLVTVAGIFALVLSTVADRLVDEAAVDDELLNEALTQPGGAGGEAVSVTPSAITGLVVVATTGQGVAGVQVVLFSSGNGVVPLASAATDGSGAYTFGRLPAGRYRVRFTGAGFDEQWYKASQTFADATDVEVAASATVALDDLELGGRPGSISGEVIVADPTGAVARLVVPGVADENADALVDELSVSADGSFLFEDVPAPANYELIVDKEGFATEVRQVVLRAAQDLEDIEVVMREGDGVVSGRVQSPSGPLGGVTVHATGGDTEVSTVTLTLDDVGAFAVRTLPTPGQYALTFEREGYESATRTVDLTAGQQLAGLAVTMAPTTGSISGTVSQQGVGPVGGVTVTVTGPDVERSTTTASVGTPGSYVFDMLPVPATYTITFAKPGLVGQSRLEDLDPLAGRATVTGIDTLMVPSTATISGVVRTAAGTPVSGAQVLLNDGSETRDVLSADDPLGRFQFSGVDPGAYTLTASLAGTSPAVLLVNVIAADAVDLDVQLEEQASLFGQVLVLDAETGQFVPFVNATVRLFLAEVFPGGTSEAVATTDAAGNYRFPGLAAPDDFVVAVYSSPSAADSLDSELVQTQPSTAVAVPTFQIRVAT